LVGRKDAAKKATIEWLAAAHDGKALHLLEGVPESQLTRRVRR
jgi:hypothetical protein